jgi:hypothetical protein
MMLGGISHAEQVEEYDLTKSGYVQSVGVNLLNTGHVQDFCAYKSSEFLCLSTTFNQDILC